MFHLSSSVGRDVLGIPMISRHLFGIDCNSSARYFGKPPHNEEAYSRSGRILVQYIVMPISVGRFAFLHSPQKCNHLAGFLYSLFNMVIPTQVVNVRSGGGGLSTFPCVKFKQAAYLELNLFERYFSHVCWFVSAVYSIHFS